MDTQMRLRQPTNTAIEDAEARWDVTFDEERRAILRSMESADIRACPGSGKTTLLVAKLGILATDWTSRHSGCCVLSHTNAARKEIEKHLDRIPALTALSGYPHFVGTIQTFLHRFLAIPAAIERFGARPSIVDNERYEIEAKRIFYEGTQTNRNLQKARYAITQWIEKDSRYENAGDYVSRLEYIDEKLSLPRLGLTKKPVSHDSTTGRELRQFKEDMSRQGYFRFGDMAALASWYAARHPTVAGFLACRFPIVFIDEMQDTVADQAALLDALLAGSVIQRFGDDRQAIYHTTSEKIAGALFPRGTVLPMQRSFRLSPSIAVLAQNVCADAPPEALVGDERKPNREHTIFVFSRNRIANVLPAYCSLVARELGTGIDPRHVKAVGASTVVRDEPHKFPSAIGDYWPSFVARNRRGKPRLAHLSDYLDKARAGILASASTTEARSTLLDACVRMLRLHGITDGDRSVTPTSLLGQLKEDNPSAHRRLCSVLAEVCLELSSGSRVNAESCGRELRATLASVLEGQAWHARVDKFCAPAVDADVSAVAVPDGDARAPDVYRAVTASGAVAVTVDTIHSVKGQTLRAVLVLETFIYEHDLHKLMTAGYLRGSRPTKKPGSRLTGQLRRIYVAMTRPTDLLCLAVLDEHIERDDRQAMRDVGWVITDV